MESIYTVTGMTCEHCVAHVAEEVSEIPGVEDVDVVLDGGRLAVTSNENIPFDAIAAAVKEAGNYSVTPA